MERISRDNFRLSTGREFSANVGYIGIASTDRDGLYGFGISEGYDGNLDEAMLGYRDYQTDQRVDLWTPAECVELADYMVEQWRTFAAAANYDACQKDGHEWSDWLTFSTSLSDPNRHYVKRRMCQRCGDAEEKRSTMA